MLGHPVNVGDAEFALQRGEAFFAECAFENGGGHFHFLQANLRLRTTRRSADRADDFVDRRQRDQLPFEHVAALLRFAKQEHRAATDDLDAVVQEFLHHRFQRKRHRAAFDEREHPDADRHLQLGELVKLVQHHVRIGTAFQFDDEANRLAVAGARFVADAADVRDAFGLHQLADLGGQFVPRHLVRHFAN